MSHRSRFSRVLLAAAVMAGSLLAVNAFQPPRAFACSCGMLPTPVGGLTPNYLLQGGATFRGTVIELSHGRFVNELNRDAVTFRVQEFWTGAITNPFVVRNSDGTCGLTFEIGEEWLIYGYIDPSGHMATSLCSRSSRIPDGEFVRDLTVLGQGTMAPAVDRSPIPIASSGSGGAFGVSWWIVASVGVAMLLAGTCLAVGMNRQRSRSR